MFKMMWAVIDNSNNVYRVYQKRTVALDEAIHLVIIDRVKRGFQPPFNINNCMRNDLIKNGSIDGFKIQSILVEENE